MQEEVENRTVNLAISTTKLTARTLFNAVRKYLQDMKNAKARNTQPVSKGKQSVKKLLGQNQGTTSVDIDKSGIKDFEKLARKYGVEFAVRKDKSVDPSRYIVFVRSKDADALDSMCREHQAKAMTKTKKPSVLKQLDKFKALIASIPKKIREKKQERDL
ncbi:MAG: PcfB family protein [Erysipelothrix sp.]